jgi:hypothetical protein
VTIAVASLVSVGAYCDTLAGDEQCPWNHPPNTWNGFLTGAYANSNRPRNFSIKFDSDIGSVARGQCYTVTYLGHRSWIASGWNQIRKMFDNEGGNPRVWGDPQNQELTVWGAHFTFSEGGEVSLNGKVVGHMYCHIGSGCDK